jgi:nitronate monooxygenase
MLGTARPGVTPATLGDLIERVRARTIRPFGVNFLAAPQLPRPDRRVVELAAASARTVEFFYGRPDGELVRAVHDGGALVSWQVGSREEALAAQEVGCNLIVAQGVEAGGHMRGTIGLLPLLAEVLPAVDLSVLAAGGVGNGRVMAAALAAGADGVRVGTRFVAAEEAGAHPKYVEALIAARAEDAVYTEAFSATWPDAPHRVLRSCVAAAEAFQGDIVGERDSLDGTRVPVRRFGSSTPDRTTNGAVEAMPFWAGESVGSVRDVQSAGSIVQELADEAESLLRRAL